MKIYAQLNEDNICVGICQLSGEVLADNMIEISNFEESYLFKKYENGVWSGEKHEPQQPVDPHQPTNAEVAQMISDLQADLIIAGVL